MKVIDIINYLDCIHIIFNSDTGIEAFDFTSENYSKFEKYYNYEVIYISSVARNNAKGGILEIKCKGERG